MNELTDPVKIKAATTYNAAIGGPLHWVRDLDGPLIKWVQNLQKKCELKT